jgi:hypothetical protein
MSLVAIPSDTWPTRYNVLPPGAKIVKTEGGRAFIVPEGGKLVKIDDLWPGNYKIEFENN